MSWLRGPLVAIPFAIMVMVLTIPTVLPATVALSVGIRAYARRRPLPDERRARRFFAGAVLGLMATSAWILAFERPVQQDALPVVLPAVALLGVVALAQALCCVGMLRHAPRERPEWTILGCLLLWAGVASAYLAYETHRHGFTLGSM